MSRDRARCRPASRRGLTLIEVLAALAIISMLLAGVATTRSRLVRQWGAADRTLAAVAAADALLAEWVRDGQLPRETAGEWGATGLAWRIGAVSNETAEALGAEVVRLEVFELRDAGAEPLVVVDTLWALPESPDETEGDDGAT